ncbi:forkhead box protein C2 isoform X2 [Drosophila hydei]|nr:forkhead box protein C2 isoform X2 [Drosophila hydei]
MEFLKPFQGPGRNSANGNGKSNDEDDNECDFGYQVLAKAASNGGEDDLKITIATATASTSALSTQTVNSYTTPILTPSVAATPPSLVSPGALSNSGAAPQNHNSNSNGSSNCAAVAPLTLSSMTPPAANCSNSSSNSGILSLPALPLSAAGKGSVSANAAALATLASLPMGIGGLPAAAAAAQMFTLKAAAAAAGLPLTSTPNCSTANNVGCLIIEPHLFAAADNFKKELSAAAAAGAPLGLFQNLANRHNLNGNAPSALGLGNPTPPPPPPAPPSSKVRRVQPSPQTTAINLSCTSSNAAASNCSQPSPAKTRKMSDPRFPTDWDVSAVLQANRELDANTLFFLSLARQVRAMPMKFQSLAKMRCMRIVSDIELELENFDCNGVPPPEESGSTANLKYCTDTPPPQQPDGSTLIAAAGGMVPEGSTEHFVYVMSPSRVESMIDISSDEESNMNGGLPATGAGGGLSAAAATGAVH